MTPLLLATTNNKWAQCVTFAVTNWLECIEKSWSVIRIAAKYVISRTHRYKSKSACNFIFVGTSVWKWMQEIKKETSNVHTAQHIERHLMFYNRPDWKKCAHIERSIIYFHSINYYYARCTYMLMCTSPSGLCACICRGSTYMVFESLIQNVHAESLRAISIN